MTAATKKRLIIGITGASGIIYGIKTLEAARELDLETHLIISKSAEQTRSYETNLSAKQIQTMADVHYANSDIAAAIASGSYKTLGMIIAPCSMRTLAEIANGVTSNLISRAADVILKERRRLVLLVRESPLHAGHLENMLKITNMGGIIAPPVPAFYNNPESIEDIVKHTIGRTFDLFDLDVSWVKRWRDSENLER